MPTISHKWIVPVATLVFLCAVYLATLQTIPNGSSHYFMIDVGETQIVLNEWGTLHATGYPLYVILGNILTNVLTTLGIAPITAPAITSLIWGLLALAGIYSLAYHLTRLAWLSAGMTLLFGLTRTLWIHNVIAEIYSFGLLLLVILLLLALWHDAIPHRIYWMAFAGGIGIAHHRAIAMSIPALLYATWPYFNRRNLPRLLIGSLLLGLAGFIQYVYLYLRAQAGAGWVYGQPGTLSGLWDEITGKEAARFIGPPETLAALLENFHTVNRVLVTDLTTIGIIAGIAGLIIAIYRPHTRRAGLTFFINAAIAYIFHVVWYRDILSALILPITLSLAFGWLFLAQALLATDQRQHIVRRVVISIAVLGTITFLTLNYPFIHTLTTDPTGQNTIAFVGQAPAESTVMLAWGPRYFAASAGKILLGQLPHIEIASDKDNLSDIASSSLLLTPDYTFFNQPVQWWQEKLGKPVFLQAVAPHFVQIQTEPIIANTPETDHAAPIAESVTCEENRIIVDIIWQAPDTPPTEDLSVFVKVFDADNNLTGQGDQHAPVYGWRPLTSWEPHERIRDIYPIEVNPAQASEINYGMYRTGADGTFENVSEYTLPVNCLPSPNP